MTVIVTTTGTCVKTYGKDYAHQVSLSNLLIVTVSTVAASSLTIAATLKLTHTVPRLLSRFFKWMTEDDREPSAPMAYEVQC